jgi:hypothetical protein
LGSNASHSSAVVSLVLPHGNINLHNPKSFHGVRFCPFSVIGVSFIFLLWVEI